MGNFEEMSDEELEIRWDELQDDIEELENQLAEIEDEQYRRESND